MSKLSHKHVTRRNVLKGAAASGLGLGVASSIYLPTAFGRQEKGNVVFWTSHTGTGWEAFQQIVENYNAQSDQWVCEAVQRPPASETDSASLITAVRSGEGPDVYFLDRFIVGERAAAGLLEDLTPLMEAAGDNTNLHDDFAGFAANEAMYNGTVYALPFNTDVRALFFNRTLVESSGVDMALFDKANGPQTFDTLLEPLRELDVKDGNNYTQMGFVPYFNQGWHYTYGFAFGGEFFDYENCQVTPDNEQVLAGLQWAQDYCNTSGYEDMYAFVQNAMRTDAVNTDSPFIQGRLGAVLTGNWVFSGFAADAPDIDFDFTFTPVANDGDDSVSWAGGWSGVIPAGAKNLEGGYDFLKYLCSSDGQRTYVEINKNLPVRLDLLSDTDLLGEDLVWFGEQFPTTRNRPVLPVGARYWDELTAQWQAIYLGQSTVEDAMAVVKSNTQGDLDAGGYCPIAPPES